MPPDEPTPEPPEPTPELTLQPLTPTSPLPSIPGVMVFEEIGKGGMGRVYKGKQQFTERPVAIKVLEPVGENTDFHRRFQREARVMASISHDHIVACLTAGTNEAGQSYIVMELIDGPDLWHWLRDHRRVEPREALRVARDLARALDHARREADLIHRDIKTANVLLAPRKGAAHDDPFPFDVKLADLGLARPTAGSGVEAMMVTQPGFVMGTPSCMAPEQFGAPDDIDFRADMYGLGCVLFHCLTGQPPFGQGHLTEVFQSKMRDEAPDPSDVEPTITGPVADLVRRMIARDRDDRHASYQALIADLERLMEDPTAVLDGAPGAAATDATGSAANLPTTAQDGRSTRRAAPPTPAEGSAPGAPARSEVGSAPSGTGRSGRRLGLIALAAVLLAAVAFAVLGGDDDPGPATGTTGAAAAAAPIGSVTLEGPDGPVPEGDFVQVSARLSEADRRSCSLSWEVDGLSQGEPAVPPIALTGADRPQVQFRAPDLVDDGTLTLTLTVSREGTADVVETLGLLIDADNDPPTMRPAPLPDTWAVGQRVELGADASDPEGGALHWELQDLDGLQEAHPGALDLSAFANTGRLTYTVPAGRGEDWRLRLAVRDRGPGGRPGDPVTLDLGLRTPWRHPAPVVQAVTEVVDGTRRGPAFVQGSRIRLVADAPPTAEGSAARVSWRVDPVSPAIDRDVERQRPADDGDGSWELDLPTSAPPYTLRIHWTARYPDGQPADGELSVPVDTTLDVSPRTRTTQLVTDSVVGRNWRWMRDGDDSRFREVEDDRGVRAMTFTTIVREAYLLPRGSWRITGRLRAKLRPGKPFGEAGLWLGSETRGALVLDVHGDGTVVTPDNRDGTRLQLCLTEVAADTPLTGHRKTRTPSDRHVTCDDQGDAEWIAFELTWDGRTVGVTLDGEPLGEPVPFASRPEEFGLFLDSGIVMLQDVELSPLP